MRTMQGRWWTLEISGNHDHAIVTVTIGAHKRPTSPCSFPFRITHKNFRSINLYNPIQLLLPPGLCSPVCPIFTNLTPLPSPPVPLTPSSPLPTDVRGVCVADAAARVLEEGVSPGTNASISGLASSAPAYDDGGLASPPIPGECREEEDAEGDHVSAKLELRPAGPQSPPGEDVALELEGEVGNVVEG